MNKISIIIPTYNCSKYIGGAIESALNQSYPDYEIIVIDDGSTDDTVEVLNKYISNECIRYIYQKNQGPGAARNKGIVLSEGEYICFLDSDDELGPDSLKLRQEVLDSYDDIMMVFTEYAIRTLDNDYIKGYLRHHNCLEYFKDSIVQRIDNVVSFNGNFVDLFYSFSPQPIWTGTVMLKKAVIDTVGYFRTDISIAEDTDYWTRIAERYTIGYIDKSTAVYNHHRSNLTQKNEEKYHLDRIKSLKSVKVTTHTRKSIIDQNISASQFSLGYYFYNNNHKLLAMNHYLKGMVYNYKNIKCLKGLAVCLLPVYLANKIKSILKR